MFRSRISRFAALSGAAAWLMVIVLNDAVNAGSPAYDADPSAWGEYLAAHNGPSDQAVLYVELLGLSLAIVFVGLLCALLRRAEADKGFLSPVALLAGGVAVAIKIGSGAPLFAALYLSDKGLSPDTMRALVNINGAAFALGFVPNGIMMLAIGTGILSYRHMPAWLGWFGIIAGVGLIVGAPFVQDEGPGFLGMLLFIVWNFAASITLFVKWPSIVAGPISLDARVASPGKAASLPI
ncbi:MAG: DUF4386 family protein [bacterium]